MIGCLNIKLERAFSEHRPFTVQTEVEVSLFYGAYEADCTKRYRREATSHGKRKEGSKEEPYARKSADRKVVVEYSSDEEPQPTEGAGAPNV